MQELKETPAGRWALAAEKEMPAAGIVPQAAAAQVAVVEPALGAAASASAVVEAGHADLKVDVALAAEASAHAEEALARFAAAYSN